MTITLPAEIAGQTDGNYSLFSFSQPQASSSSITENRFVLAISLSSPASSQVLKTWEPNLLKNMELLYSSLPDNMPANIIFTDSERQSAFTHRFVNFGSPDLSLDYIIAGNKIIFSTSKQSADKILDVISKTDE